METEEWIRSRIEAILASDARNHAEVRRVASEEGLPAEGGNGVERNLYQRVINTYRNAIAEVNRRFEENVWFLSGFYRILESIKDEGDFQETCLRVVDCVLQEFGAEYCALVVSGQSEKDPQCLCVEGIQETEKFISVHSRPLLAGSEELANILMSLAAEEPAGVAINDVYVDARFQNIDFPSVIRSLACLPIVLRSKTIGVLALAHSIPCHFSGDHARILRILAGLLANIRRLDAGSQAAPVPMALRPTPEPAEEGFFSVVLMDFEIPGPGGRYVPLDRETVLLIRRWIAPDLTGRECALFYGERNLLLVLPGTPADALLSRIRDFQTAFLDWKKEQSEKWQEVRMNIGYSTCRADEDMLESLHAASAVMHADREERSA
jgi:putative methionine-R-sulfoxide reductase with GAF domain